MINMRIELVKDICGTLGVVKVTETHGHQVFHVPKVISLELWIQPKINAVIFASEEIRQMKPDLKIIRVRPFMASEAEMVV